MSARAAVAALRLLSRGATSRRTLREPPGALVPGPEAVERDRRALGWNHEWADGGPGAADRAASRCGLSWALRARNRKRGES